METYIQRNGTFKNSQGLEIYYQSWEKKNPAGIMVIAHGLGEYSQRYKNFVNSMDKTGWSFFALDHRGHGYSQGKRGHINTFNDYLNDLKLLVDLIKQSNPGIPLILLGHSMGGVIAFQYILNYPNDFKGLILSSAGLIPAVSVPQWKKSLAQLLSRFFPALSISNGLDARYLSHDTAVVQDYLADPLVHDRVTARWYVEFTRAGEECLSRADELTLPLLIIHGKDDKIVDYRGSEQVFKTSKSTDKKLFLFDNLYHETMNETAENREKVLAVIREWLM